MRFLCTNLTAKGSRSTVLSTPGKKEVLGIFPILFGRKQVHEIMPYTALTAAAAAAAADAAAGDAAGDDNHGNLDTDQARPPPKDSHAVVSGYISKAANDAGRGSSDRQFLSINNRPCDMPKVSPPPHTHTHRCATCSCQRVPRLLFFFPREALVEAPVLVIGN